MPSQIIIMNKAQEQHIEAVRALVQAEFSGEGTGHDWWHMWRVWHMARRIGTGEGANMYVVELAALLHDIADHKFHNGDRTVGAARARTILAEIGVEETVVAAVCDIIPKVSFSGSGGERNMDTLEGKVVQDADRLDALGALGICRTMQYGGHKKRLIYVPDEDSSPNADTDRADSSIQHFYDKLLKLHGLMNTNTGRAIADQRHEYMEQFLEQFYAEWNGQR